MFAVYNEPHTNHVCGLGRLGHVESQKVNLGQHLMKRLGLPRVAQRELRDNVAVHNAQTHRLCQHRDLAWVIGSALVSTWRV
jgi:hypothetical protein